MNPEKYLRLVTLDYPPNEGGVARYLHGLVEASTGAISVIADERLREPRTVAGVEYRRFFRSFWPRWWPLVRLCREGGRTGKALFISHVLPIGTAAWISRVFFHGSPYILLFHGLDLRLLNTAWKRWLARRMIRNAKICFVNSASTGRDFDALIPDVSSIVLTPGVDFPGKLFSRAEARSFLDIRDDEHVIVSLARLISRKGVDIALQAVAKLQREGHHIRYIVLGDGPDRSRLEAIAQNHGVLVEWVLHPTDNEKWKYLAASDIFLLPVRDEGRDVEGFGIVFLEAAACGVPSIAGRSGGAVEAVLDQQTGVLVDPTSVDDTVRAIRRLLDHPDERRRMGECARKRVERDFRWSDRWQKISEVLQRI